MFIKNIFITIICLCFIIAINVSTAQKRPDIVWERNDYKFDSLTNIWMYSLLVTEEKINIWLEGSSIESEGLNVNRGSAFVRTNLKGDILSSVERFRGQSSLFASPFLVKAPSLSVIGEWHWPRNSQKGWEGQVRKVDIDENGNYEETIPDMVDSTVYSNSVGISYVKDSLYVSVDSRRFDTTVYQYYFDQLLKVYDQNAKFVRNLYIDTTGLDAPIDMGHQQTFVFPSHDNTLIGTLYGPGATKQSTEHLYVCKFDLSGNIIWKCKIKREGYDFMHIIGVFQLPNLDYFVHGCLIGKASKEKPARSGIFLARLTKDGQKLWYKQHEFEDGHKAYGTMKPIQNSNYFVYFRRALVYENGAKLSFFMTFFDSDGNKYDEYVWNTEPHDNAIEGVEELPNGNLIVLGRAGWDTFYLAEIRPGIVTKIEEEAITNHGTYEIKISPNPGYDILNISIISANQNVIANCKLYDISGNEIIEFNMPQYYSLNTKELSSGIYFINFEITDGYSKNISKVTRKIIIKK